MTDLSPAAQAVHEAAWSAYWIKDAEAPQDAELIAAAALRVAADRVIEEVSPVEAILAIADELENH